MSNKLLYKIDGLVEGQVIKRPSLYVRSPYVSDIKTEENDGSILAHSPSLGCCGLADAGATILMIPSLSKSKPKNELGLQCEYSIYLSKIENDVYVGIHPKMAEKLVKSAIENNCISCLKNIKSLRQETSIYIKDKVDSRFDFSGLDENGIPFIMEVKNVPLADYEDCDKKERTKMDFSNRPFDSKVAYFPDGYRKTTYDPVSPRALKHIQELTYLKKEEPKFRCIMCYVIQRTDVNRFQASVIDPQYRDAFCKARDAGVEIITMVIKWTADGSAYFVRDDLPISC
jgi:DNA-binding sugar fermentation-stimulating protein